MKPLSLWGLTFIALVVIAVGYFSTYWLYSIALSATLPGRVADPALRIDAIRTGLTVAAGTGGAFGLLLAFRRQRSSEIGLLHQIDDANARRVGELYTKAVDQLGSVEAPVRLGGLYALERLAATTPEQRQTVVSVICAYLRMPYKYSESILSAPYIMGEVKPRSSSAARRHTGMRRPALSDRSTDQELHVRKTAQNILLNHLKTSYHGFAFDSDRFWPGMALNLQGAQIIDADFSGIEVVGADFLGATFHGRADFSHSRIERLVASRARFKDEAIFSNAEFTDVTFHSTRFEGWMQFVEVQVDAAKFQFAEFYEFANFYKTNFNMVACFSNARFRKIARFEDATFRQFGRKKNSGWGIRDFSDCVFDEDVIFEGAASSYCSSDTWPPLWCLDRPAEEREAPMFQPQRDKLWPLKKDVDATGSATGPSLPA